MCWTYTIHWRSSWRDMWKKWGRFLIQIQMRCAGVMTEYFVSGTWVRKVSQSISHDPSIQLIEDDREGNRGDWPAFLFPVGRRNCLPSCLIYIRNVPVNIRRFLESHLPASSIEYQSGWIDYRRNLLSRSPYFSGRKIIGAIPAYYGSS